MVGPASLVFMVLSMLISVFVPIGLAIYFYRKYRVSLKAVLAGALVFVVFQLITRIPLLTVLSNQLWYQRLALSLVFLALFLSLTAGLFEEVGRYLGFRYFLIKELVWKNGIAYGIGHGGIESIVLVGLTYVNNIVISIMINTGTFDRLIAPLIGAAEAEYIRRQLVDLPPAVFAMAGIERLFAIVIQIALSLVVLYAVKNRKIIFLIYAILLHALVNIPAIFIVGEGLSPWYAQLYLFLLAAAGAVFTVRFKKRLDNGEAAGG